MAYARECLRMPDGGTVALDWPMLGPLSNVAARVGNSPLGQPLELPPLTGDAPVLILLPGLTGGSGDRCGCTVICLHMHTGGQGGAPWGCACGWVRLVGVLLCLCLGCACWPHHAPCSHEIPHKQCRNVSIALPTCCLHACQGIRFRGTAPEVQGFHIHVGSSWEWLGSHAH